MIKYVLFDLDGTLTDPKQGITECVRHALKSCGIEPPDADSLLCFIGPPLTESFMKYYNMTEMQAEVALKKYRERFSVVGMFENKVYDGVPEMLGQLTDMGLTLAVASLKPVVFVKKILEHFELDKYFSAICGSDLEGTKHTKKQIIDDALSLLPPVSPSEIIMVGDRYHDIEGAKAAEIISLGVRYGYAAENELEKAGADFIAGSPAEVVQIIKNHP